VNLTPVWLRRFWFRFGIPPTQTYVVNIKNGSARYATGFAYDWHVPAT